MPQETPPVVIGLGEILWDMLPEGKQLGGAPANFAYHARAAGADAQPVSCIGDDPLGREILDHLRRLGMPTDFVAIDAVNRPTGTVSVELDDAGKPTFTIHEDVAWDFIPEMPGLAELAARTDAVCYGSLAQRSPVSRATVRKFLNATPGECLRIFDINLRQHYYDVGIVTDSLDAADVLKLNDDELPVVAELLSMDGDAEEQELLDSLLHRFNLKLIALTKGERGSTLFGHDGGSVLPGCKVEIADTVGAGDAFTAVLAMGMLQGLDYNTINERANRIAAYVCSQAGATPVMPDSLVGFDE